MSNILVAPLEALTDSELTDPERRVLLALFSWRGKTTNTVWPSLGEIGMRANISDPTRISKLTNSLAQKGWLTKKKKGFTGCNEYTLVFPDRLNIDDANLDSDTKLEAESKLVPDTHSNLDSDTKYKEQTIEQTSSKKINKKNTGMKTMKAWLNELRESGEKAIPDDDSIFEYAADSQIPHDWLRLVWVEFKAEFSEKNKRQIDWRQHFRNFVRKNYYKLWWVDQGEYKLTSRGEQAMIAMRNRDRREAS